MIEFILMANFPKSEIEFDLRLLNESAYFDYLFKMKWPNGFSFTKYGHQAYWLSSKNLYICKSSIFSGIEGYK